MNIFAIYHFFNEENNKLYIQYFLSVSLNSACLFIWNTESKGNIIITMLFFIIKVKFGISKIIGRRVMNERSLVKNKLLWEFIDLTVILPVCHMQNERCDLGTVTGETTNLWCSHRTVAAPLWLWASH